MEGGTQSTGEHGNISARTTDSCRPPDTNITNSSRVLSTVLLPQTTITQEFLALFLPSCIGALYPPSTGIVGWFTPGYVLYAYQAEFAHPSKYYTFLISFSNAFGGGDGMMRKDAETDAACCMHACRVFQK